MEEIQLSPAALREQAALKAINEKMRLEALELETRIQALEEIARRKKEVIRRQEEFLAEIRAERQAIEADFQRILHPTPTH